MKRLVVVYLFVVSCLMAYAVSVFELDNNEQTTVIIQNQSAVNSGYCYYVNDTPHTGKRSSIIEERLNKNKNKDKYYDPPLSRFVNLMSANEYLVQEWQNSKDESSQFVTHNSIGVKFPYAGLEAFYKQIRTTNNNGGSAERRVNQMGIGGGLPNAELIRAVVFGVQNDYSDYYATYNEDAIYSGVKAQVAKRFRSDNQFTEIGGEYEVYDIPKNYNPPYSHAIASNFTNTALDWTPNSRINGYVVASSITNRYLEPNNFSGLGSAASPLLLVNGMAHAFTVRGIVEDRKKPAEEFRNTKLDINLAMNFSKYAGIDLGYLFNRDEDTDIITAANGGVIETTEINESSGILAGMRIALVNFDLLRFISGIQYYRHKEQLPTEFISFSGNLVIKITHHLAIIGTFKHNNLWLPDEGTFKLDPLGFYYGSSLTVRL